MAEDGERKPSSGQRLRGLSEAAESLDAKRISAFVAVSTLFVALLSYYGGSVSFDTPGEQDCERDIGRASFLTYFPSGRENPSRTLIVELNHNAFVQESVLEMNTEDPEKPFCPKLVLVFTEFTELNSIGFQVTHPEERFITFKRGIIGVEVNLRGDEVISYRERRVSTPAK